MNYNFRKWIAIGLIFLLTGCSAPSSSSAAQLRTLSTKETSEKAPTQKHSTQQEESPVKYVVPAFCDSVFSSEKAEVPYEGLQVDYSHVENGYVTVSLQSGNRHKFQVLHGEEKYNYDLRGDAVAEVYPLQCGDGAYTFRVMENIVDNQYVERWSFTVDVVMKDEFQPFIRPSQYVNYTQSSQCVSMARKIAEECTTDTDVVCAVYSYLCDAIAYDDEKAASVQKGYLPDPDETLASGKGICFDYAALSAAMLRSVGVPTRLITGYVGDIYHAWNAIYLKEQGWITLEIKASTDEWQRIDVTFAASGTDPAFLTDDGNYITRYTY